MKGLMQYPVAESTGMAHESIDSILAGNREEYQQGQYDLHGTVGPTPFMETEEGQQSLMDIAMGSAFPGSAVGRISKAAVTGGQQILPRAIKHFKRTFGKQRSDADIRNVIKDYFDQMMGKAKSSKTMDEGMDYLKKKSKAHITPTSERSIRNQINWDNKVNPARIRMEKAYNKSGIQHERQLMDPVSEILRGYKYRKN